MITTKELLIKAKALIADPTHWTQHRAARNKAGVAVPLDISEAVCFCSFGAARRAALLLGVSPVPALNALDRAAGNHSRTASCIVTFNDTHTHEEVMEVWDKAIHLAKQDECAKGDKA